MGLIEGKVILVTGASRGVGRGIALGAASEGAIVIASARTMHPEEAPRVAASGLRLPGSLVETVAAVRALGADAHAIRCDLTKDGDIEHLVEEVIARHGRIDILVNNAMVTGPISGTLVDLPVASFDALLTVGARSAYVVTRAAAPHMMRAKRGLIVNISSACASIHGYSVAFCVMCAALDRLAQGFAHDLRDHDVAAVSLWPNFVRTERVLLEAGGEETGYALGQSVDPATEADSPELQGRAIAHLAADPHVMEMSGKVLVVSDLAERYGFRDIDGRAPRTIMRVEQLRRERGSIAPLAYD
jgi:dehydrogenase/reductase SDR family protein 1